MSVAQLIMSPFQPFAQAAQSGYQQIKEKGIRLAAWDHFFEFAAPITRNFDVAYAPLQRIEADGLKVDVGSFIPEYYTMAEAGLLPKQIKAKAFFDNLEGSDAEKAEKLKADKPGIYRSLYHTDGRLKSSFELSMIPYYRHEKIQRVLSKTYVWLKDNGYPWPHPISKIRVEEDYLARLSESGLCIKNDEDEDEKYMPTSGVRSMGVQSVYLSIANSHKHATFREKILHGIGPWLAWLVTLTATLSILGLSSWGMLAAAGIGTYVAMNCANAFDMFDKAEALYRDIGWVMSKHYPTIGKLSRSNLLKTAIKSAGLAFVAFSAGMSAGAGLLELPFLVWAPAIEMGLAIFFGTIAAIGSFVGLSGAIRYLDGLSISDNQIDIHPNEAKNLKVVVESELIRNDVIKAFKKVVKTTLEPGEIVDLSELLSARGNAYLNIQQGEVIIVGKEQVVTNDSQQADINIDEMTAGSKPKS